MLRICVKIRWIARHTMRRTAVMRWNSQAHMPPLCCETASAFNSPPLPAGSLMSSQGHIGEDGEADDRHRHGSSRT